MNGTLNAELSDAHQRILRDAAEEVRVCFCLARPALPDLFLMLNALPMRYLQLAGPGRYRSAKDLDMVSLYIMGPSRYSPPLLENMDKPENASVE